MQRTDLSSALYDEGTSYSNTGNRTADDGDEMPEDIYAYTQGGEQQETTHDNVQEDELTAHDENVINEMNATIMNQDPDIRDEVHSERQMAGNTDTYRYKVQLMPQTRQTTGETQSGTDQTTISLCGTPKPHTHVMMTQMSIKVGIQNGNDALMKELQQLHYRKAIIPKRKDDRTHEDKKKTTR